MSFIGYAIEAARGRWFLVFNVEFSGLVAEQGGAENKLIDRLFWKISYS